MITRYALFEGSIAKGQTEAFRAAVLQELLPKWQAFPGALGVRVTFADERDEGAPEFPLILAIDYPDREAVTKVATEALLPRFFTGRILHHITTAHSG